MKKLYEPDEIFFTSDLHFGHRRILEFTNRPWETVDEMNEGLIRRWNEFVPDDATVVVAGDVAFTSAKKAAEFLSRMNGKKILVIGNHDRGLMRKPVFREQFVYHTPLLELKVSDPDGPQRIVVCHYAMRIWNDAHKGSWHLYGHSHGNLAENGTPSFDIGIDTDCNWRPRSYWEVKSKMAGRTFVQVDHHVPLA